MNIQDVLDWLQDAEDNGIDTVGTQNVKRHLEEVQKKQLILSDVGRQKGKFCDHRNKTQHFSDVFGVYKSCSDCGLNF